MTDRKIAFKEFIKDINIALKFIGLIYVIYFICQSIGLKP